MVADTAAAIGTYRRAGTEVEVEAEAAVAVAVAVQHTVGLRIHTIGITRTTVLTHRQAALTNDGRMSGV